MHECYIYVLQNYDKNQDTWLPARQDGSNTWYDWVHRTKPPTTMPHSTENLKVEERSKIDIFIDVSKMCQNKPASSS
jgi:hypothetical protein